MVLYVIKPPKEYYGAHFKCERCGIEFITNEYEVAEHPYDSTREYSYCDCPNCGYEVHDEYHWHNEKYNENGGKIE